MGKTKESKNKSKSKSDAKTNPQVKTKTANRKNLEVNVKSEVKSKSLTSVKNASIVKQSQTPKAKSKKIAKEVATKLKSNPELKQKSKKPPPKSPSPPIDDDDSSSEDDSESSDSSSDSPVKDQAVINPTKLQMESVKKDAQPKDEDSDTSESDSSDSSESDDGISHSSSDSDESSSEDGENGQLKNDSNNDSSNDSSDDSNESDSSSPETNNHAKINSKKSKDKQNGISLPSSNGTVVSKNKPTSNGASHLEDKTSNKSSEDESNSDENDSDSDSDENESDSDSNESSSDTNNSGPEDNKSESDSNESDSNSSSNKSDSEVDRSSKKRKAEPGPTPPVKKAKSVSNEGSKNLFVGNLSWNVDDEWLVREFEEFGEIIRANVLTDKATGRSKGFGYVEFSNSESAKAALEAKKGSLIDGREANVDFSTPRDENARERTKGRAQQFGDSVNSPSDTLFCGNLSFGANEDMIGEAFGAHGTVVNVRLPTDMESGNPKGFGYVTFASIDEAKTAYEAMLGAEIDGRVVRLDYATPRPDRGAGFGSRGGRGRGDGRGRGGSRGGTRGGARGGRGGSTNRGGFGDFRGQKKTF